MSEYVCIDKLAIVWVSGLRLKSAVQGGLLLLAIGLAGLAARPLAAVEGAANIAEEALLADDSAAAEAAFVEQSQDESRRARLAAIVERLAGATRQRWEATQKKLATDVNGALDLQALSQLATAATEHRAAAKSVLAFLFNDKQYPVPAEAAGGWRPGVDVQPGQAEMEKLYAAAFEKYEPLERAYHAQLLRLIASLKPGEEKTYADDPQPPLPEYLAAVEKLRTSATPPRGQLAVNRALTCYALRAPDLTLERALALLAERMQQIRLLHRKLTQLEGWRERLRAPAPATAGTPAQPPAAAPDPGPDLPPAVQALVALADEDFSRAAGLARSLPQAAGFAAFWQLTCSHALLIQNRCRQGLQPHENWTLREINLYRLSLAERPLAINDKLQAMARKHGEAMQKKKFFGHYDPDEARRTPAKRAALENYSGAVGENLAGGQDGTRCLWRWRSDAGHHRVMVIPGFVEAGLAEVGDCEIFDAGATAAADIQKLFSANRGSGAAGNLPTLPASSDPARPNLILAP